MRNWGLGPFLVYNEILNGRSAWGGSGLKKNAKTHYTRGAILAGVLPPEKRNKIENWGKK